MTVPAEVHEAIEALRDLHVAGLGSVAEIEEAVRSAGRVRVWADSVLSSLAARADALSANEGAGRGGETVLRAAARLSNHASNAAGRRAEVASSYPAFGAAFAKGAVTGEHLDVLGRVASNASPEVLRALADAEADLLAAACSIGPERFARQVKGMAEIADPKHTGTALEQLEAAATMRMWRGRDGLHHFAGVFGPTTGAAAVEALRQEAARLAREEHEKPLSERRSAEQLQIEALTNLVNGGHAQRHPGRTTLAVHVGLERLLGAGDGVCETSGGVPLPIEIVREMALDAEIIPILLDEEGRAIGLSRFATSRLASFVQRVMLRAMHRSCTLPGCEVPFDDCHIHHLRPFDGRNTVLANLAPFCSKNHHDVHDRGMRIELDEHRNVTVRGPAGEVWAHEPFRPPGARPREAAA